MKIACPCGELIYDGTDCLPNKAYLLADQDWFNLGEVAGDEPAPILELNSSWRTIYQCASCGRLTLDDPVTGEMLWFAPENDHRRKALGSVEGNAFKVILRGRWRPHQGQGDVWWGSGGDREGGFEEFDDKAKLERRYHQVFEMLSGEARLLNAWLDGGEAMLHRWPPVAAA